jgi:hypothetical protein
MAFVMFFIICAVIVSPYFYRLAYIESILKISLPDSVRFIDFYYGISTWGLDPFYAKLELDYDTFATLTKNSSGLQYTSTAVTVMKSICTRSSLNLDDTKTIYASDVMASKFNYISFAATTKVIYFAVTSEVSGQYYLYVVH